LSVEYAALMVIEVVYRWKL